MFSTNLCARAGLINGTRCTVDSFSTHVITVTLTAGPRRGSKVLVPRIVLRDDKVSPPKVLTRYQFPLRPAYAMTIHRAQGQTLNTVGVYLRTPVFPHGMLYCALQSCFPTRPNVPVCARLAIPGPSNKDGRSSIRRERGECCEPQRT
ncbi:hypothetical protein ONE63_001078 [Megalurothrips usitatus]|uniref:Uncharacterized protein n=1 Tax=Megalurothrips usitatus TaxID=439358 RepID=A0AAV7XAX3_9NEOP|nr:hypothetical protein ONE63_001078 [Megalurothrips usitatus]